MFSRIFLMRRARLIVHYYLRQHSQSNSTCLSTFAKHKHTTAEASLCQRGCPNQQKVQQHQNASAELLVTSVSSQQQRICSYGQTEDRPSSCGEDVPLQPGSAFVKLSALKSGQKQKLGGHSNVMKERAQRQNGSVKILASNRGPCSNDNANTFECMTCSQDTKDHFHHGTVKGYESSGDSSVPSMTCWGSELSGFSASAYASASKGNDDGVLASSISNSLCRLAELRMSSQPLLKALESSKEEDGLELLRKVQLVEQLSPNGAARLLQNGAFMRCSFEQLEAVIKVLRNFLVSNERVFKVLARNNRVLSHPVDLLQQKLKLLTFYQIEKETLDRLSTFVSVLSMNVDALQEKLALFEEVGLSTEARNKILCLGPFIMNTSIENLIKTINFLMSIGATRERLSVLLKLQPHVLCLSFDNNVFPRYKYFQQIGISAEKIPIVLAFSSRTTMDIMKANTQCLKDSGFSDGDVRLLLQKQPSIVARASKTLKMIVDFLVHEMKWNTADIVRYPRCLALSLQNRIIPRCRLAEEHGLSKVYSLTTILSRSDSDFEKLLRK